MVAQYRAQGGSGSTSGVDGDIIFSLTTTSASPGSIYFKSSFSTTVMQITKDSGSGASKIGFFNVTPITKPTVTGSRATGAALVSLLSKLSDLGLITDSTTV